MHDRENRRFRKLIKIFRDFQIIFRRIQSFHELVNCILTTKFIKSMNSTKVARRTPTTTIFKLIGPCEILSHGQKSEKSETTAHFSGRPFSPNCDTKVTHLTVHIYKRSKS